MKDITELEFDVLKAVWDCDYRDGDNVICYSSEIYHTCEKAKGKQISACVKNLIDKGFLKPYDDDCVELTDAGRAVLRERGLFYDWAK